MALNALEVAYTPRDKRAALNGRLIDNTNGVVTFGTGRPIANSTLVKTAQGQ